ncbi:MAG: leucine-rich repeat protein, partial [Verrucomicrobia bacterium]|nr:leucine-rich repeat protein [Verrucomicrobiota bacterium]
MSKKQNLKLYGVCLAAAGSLFLNNQAQAAVGDSFISDDNTFKFTVLTEEGSTGTVSVIAANKYIGTEVVIPSTVKYNDITYTVTTLGTTAFYNCTFITSITIPDTVTTMERHAFASCERLTELVIP